MGANVGGQISGVVFGTVGGYMEGMEMPQTFSPPHASAAMAATSAESMPPEGGPASRR